MLHPFDFLNYHLVSRQSYNTGATQWSLNVYFKEREQALRLKETRVIYGETVLTRNWSRQDQAREDLLAQQERKKRMTI